MKHKHKYMLFISFGLLSIPFILVKRLMEHMRKQACERCERWIENEGIIQSAREMRCTCRTRKERAMIEKRKERMREERMEKEYERGSE